MQRILDAGGSRELALQAASDAIQQALTKAAPSLATDLVRRSPKMLRARRRNSRRVGRRIRAHWGKALDLFMMLSVASEESGGEFDEQHRPPDGVPFDPVYDALLGLHARACRTALEVYHLLSGGLPMGALARSRTLHEIAVTAMVIADHGRRPGHTNLADRFLDHAVVATYKDAIVYQEHCATLGTEPFSDDEMAAMKAKRDAAVTRYGPAFREQYGWAAGLDGSHAPNFRDVERLAEVSHLRGHYSWASHEVHSDSKGWALNTREWGDTLYRETSYSNSGLAEPGHMALISLHQSNVSLLFSPEETSPRSILACESMALLLDRAGDAFVAGHEAAERHNTLVQQRQARWGRPYATWRRLTRR
jgi:hypothetical protein